MFRYTTFVNTKYSYDVFRLNTINITQYSIINTYKSSHNMGNIMFNFHILCVIASNIFLLDKQQVTNCTSQKVLFVE